jgi:hypothetical protein
MEKYIHDINTYLTNNGSIINNEFFQHMFLDYYTKDGNGNNSDNSCNIFILLLKIYKEKYKSKNGNIINKNIDETINLLVNTSEIIKLNHSDYNSYKNKIIKILNDNNQVFI